MQIKQLWGGNLNTPPACLPRAATGRGRMKEDEWLSGDDAAADFLAIRYFFPGFRPRPEVGRARSYHANISVGVCKYSLGCIIIGLSQHPEYMLSK